MNLSRRPAQTTKRIVQRTCVSCRQIKAKQDLVRLVHTPDGNIEIDNTGKKAGRGAYLCRAGECWETGLKGSRLEHALRGTLTQDNREELKRWSQDQLKGAD